MNPKHTGSLTTLTLAAALFCVTASSARAEAAEEAMNPGPAAETGTAATSDAAAAPEAEKRGGVSNDRAIGAVQRWNQAAPELYDISAYALFEAGNILLDGDRESVLGFNFGGEVRLHDRVGVGFDYVHASGIFGPSGTLVSPYVFFDLRAKDSNARFRPFISAGPGAVDVDNGGEGLTVHAGAGARLQLAKNLGIRADARWNQPIQNITSYYEEPTRVYTPAEIHFIQTRLGLYVSW